jgi:outer membrane protein assembly factor BamB
MRGGRTAGLTAVAVLTLVLATAGGAAGVPRAPWLAYGRTADAQNASATPIILAAAKTMHAVWKTKVGGMLTAQPLYAPDVTVAGKARQLAIVASGSNVVTALDLGTGRIVWRRSLGPLPAQVCGGAGGVESTPVIDAAGHRIFVIGGDGKLLALDLGTGKPVAGWSVPIITRTHVEVVWGALRLASGKIYVPVASWCDKGDESGPWDGRLVQVDEKTHRIVRTFDVVPGPKNGGSIWGPGGVSIDSADGSIWTGTANAVVYQGENLQERAPLAERIVHLSPGFKVLASVVEPDTNPSVAGDQGFGSTPMLFTPAGCPAMVAANSKDSYTYVWRRSALTAAPVLRLKLGESGATNTFYAQPTWFPATRTLVVDGTMIPGGQGTKGAVGLRLQKNCTFKQAWSVNIGGGVQPQPLAAGRVAFVPATSFSKVYAIDSQTGVILNAFETGQPTYTAPMIAGSLLLLGSADGTVFAFGH